jgi:hypothetical protein
MDSEIAKRGQADCCIGSDGIFPEEKEKPEDRERKHTVECAFEYPHIKLLVSIL